MAHPKTSLPSWTVLGCRLALAAAMLCAWPLLRAQGAPHPSQAEQPAQANSKFVVEDLRIEGQVDDADAVRARILKTLQGREYERHRHSLDDICSKIEADFQDHGYFKVSVDDLRAQPLDAEKHTLLVIARVNPGPLYQAGRISFASDDPSRPLLIPEAELRQQFHFQTGDPFSAREIRKGTEGIRQMYFARGYLDVTATPEFSVDSQNRSIATSWQVHQGNQYRVGSLDVRGLGPGMIARLKSELRPGSPFSQTLARQLFSQGKAAAGAGMAFDSFDDVVSLTPHAETRTVDVLFDFSSAAAVPN